LERRLHRSEEERVIFGVCGGIAAYLDLDPTLVRVLFVLGAVFSSGFVILAYIVLAVIMPAAERAGRITGEVVRQNLDDLEARTRELGDDLRHIFGRGSPEDGSDGGTSTGRRSDAWIIGLVLVVAGIIFLLDNLRVLSWWQFGQLWPLILVVVGIALLLRRRER